jgi:hypothetical protein
MVMAHGALDQRAAHNLPGYRQFGNQRLARLDGSVMFHRK